MDLCVIGPKHSAPQLIALHAKPEAFLKQHAAEAIFAPPGRRAPKNIEPPELFLHRSYSLSKGWDALALKLAKVQLYGTEISDSLHNVSPGEATVAVDKAFRAIQLPAADKLPVIELAPIMREIRGRIFAGCTQEVLGAICGVSPSKVSRWEAGEFEPGLTEIFRMRAFALANGLPWDDTILFPQEQTD